MLRNKQWQNKTARLGEIGASGTFWLLTKSYQSSFHCQYYQLCMFSFHNNMTEHNPAGTWRKYNVASMSMQRHDIASTLRRRYIYVMCLPGKVVFCNNAIPTFGKSNCFVPVTPYSPGKWDTPFIQLDWLINEERRNLIERNARTNQNVFGVLN